MSGDFTGMSWLFISSRPWFYFSDVAYCYVFLEMWGNEEFEFSDSLPPDTVLKFIFQPRAQNISYISLYISHNIWGCFHQWQRSSTWLCPDHHNLFKKRLIWHIHWNGKFSLRPRRKLQIDRVLLTISNFPVRWFLYRFPAMSLILAVDVF